MGEFRQFFEIADFAKKDTSGIAYQARHSYSLLIRASDDCRNSNPMFSGPELISCRDKKLENIPADSFHRTFSVNGEEFTVTLAKINVLDGEFGHTLKRIGIDLSKVQKYFNNVYDIGLRGPNGYNTTKSNKGATEVYSQLLLTVKKIHEDHKIEGLSFKPHEMAMSLIYSRFISNFTDFQIVDATLGLYLSNKIIDALTLEYPKFADVVRNNNQIYKNSLSNIRQIKRQNREDEKLSRTLIGKVVLFTPGIRKEIGMVFGTENSLVRLYHLGQDNMMYKAAVNINSLYRLSDNPGFQSRYENFLAILADAEDQIRLNPYSYDNVLRQAAKFSSKPLPYNGPLPSDGE